MLHLICNVMSTKYNVNVYDGDLSSQVIDTPALSSLTDGSQATSVRDILTRYQITGVVYGRDPSRDSFITELNEDEDTSERSDKVNDALDTPDLSYMDEMEMHDFVRDNLSLTKVSDQTKTTSPMEPRAQPQDPPAQPPEPDSGNQ